MNVKAIFMAAVVAAILVPAATFAQSIDTDARHRVVVRTDDVDLVSRDGQGRLDRRIRAAATAACPRSGVPQLRWPEMVCRREAYWRTLGQRDRLIAQARAARSGGPGASYLVEAIPVDRGRRDDPSHVVDQGAARRNANHPAR